uniref:Uncharacterized protein n=1 Tax=viral metagenome TaxID=1070528 RepID=A0A6M3XSY5_9ZZZZ
MTPEHQKILDRFIEQANKIDTPEYNMYERARIDQALNAICRFVKILDGITEPVAEPFTGYRSPRLARLGNTDNLGQIKILPT